MVDDDRKTLEVLLTELENRSDELRETSETDAHDLYFATRSLAEESENIDTKITHLILNRNFDEAQKRLMNKII